MRTEDVTLFNGKLLTINLNTLEIINIWEFERKGVSFPLQNAMGLEINMNGEHTCGTRCKFIDSIVICEKCNRVIDFV